MSGGGNRLYQVTQIQNQQDTYHPTLNSTCASKSATTGAVAALQPLTRDRIRPSCLLCRTTLMNPGFRVFTSSTYSVSFSLSSSVQGIQRKLRTSIRLPGCTHLYQIVNNAHLTLQRRGIKHTMNGTLSACVHFKWLKQFSYQCLVPELLLPPHDTPCSFRPLLGPFCVSHYLQLLGYQEHGIRHPWPAPPLRIHNPKKVRLIFSFEPYHKNIFSRKNFFPVL